MPEILAFARAYWPYILIALLAMFAWGAWERGDAAIAHLATFKATVEAAGKVGEANAARQRAERTTITAQQESKHAGDNLRLTTELDSLRARISSADKTKPVSGTASICDDEAKDKRLSLIISEHLREVRRIIAGERTETLGLIGDAQKQTDELINFQEWATLESAVK